VLLGFTISLSSTAVVVSMLRTWGGLDTDTGRDALGILLIIQGIRIMPAISFLLDRPTPLFNNHCKSIALTHIFLA
jgi:predicted Kef-type K+ transport protein